MQLLDVCLAAFVVALQVPDITTTREILALGGRELNPVVRLMMRLGRGWWVPKFLLAAGGAAALAVIGGRSATLALAALCVVYALAVLSNWRQLRRMKRRLGR